jgi:DNA topoisomerase-1
MHRSPYEGMPVTKGKGRFGPFIKWNDLYINVPRAYNFDALTQKDIDELIEKKQTKKPTGTFKIGLLKKLQLKTAAGVRLSVWQKNAEVPYKGKGEKYTAEELAHQY